MVYFIYAAYGWIQQMTDNSRLKDRDRSIYTDNGIEKVLFNVQCLFAVRFAVIGNLLQTIRFK